MVKSARAAYVSQVQQDCKIFKASVALICLIISGSVN